MSTGIAAPGGMRADGVGGRPSCAQALECDLRGLWAETFGDPRICIAILDGPVDRTHPSLRGANLRQVESLAADAGPGGLAARHGTHVASILFGRHDGPVRGIAPGCRGVSIPVFASAGERAFRSCSQLDLARAIGRAVQHGAHVINISGGEFAPSGAASPLLAHAVRACSQLGIVIVAAAGNDGCDCMHLPAGVEGVLAVGAMNAEGAPLPFSNWGGNYRTQAILAPGEAIPGAVPGGGTAFGTGTSFAAAVVSGVVGLLLSLQLRRGRRPDPLLVQAALLRSALGCGHAPVPDCSRLLAGRLNVRGAALSLIAQQRTPDMTEATVPQAAQPAAPAPEAAPNRADATPTAAVQASAVQPSACGCASCDAPAQLVYALGQLGYDLVREARLDSLAQKMAGEEGSSLAERVIAFDPRRMLAYLDANPWDAPAVEWTLSLDGTPIYALRPQGPFAGDAYKQLRQFLRDQLDGGVERVSIPGVITGKATLLLGQVVPVVAPELRGMYSWSTAALAAAVAGPAPGPDAPQEHKDAHAAKTEGVGKFLDRVYHELRNLGMMPQDRAVNFAATNAFALENMYESALKEQMELESIHMARSPICRPGSDCWDVEAYFFYPARQVQTVRKVYRFTVDVSDVVPVTVGPMRSWFTR